MMMIILEIWTPYFAHEPKSFPRCLETKESVFDLEWKILGRLLRHAIQPSATENSVLHKSCGTKITHRIIEKVAWKQTELNEHRNSKITLTKLYSIKAIAIKNTYTKMNGEYINGSVNKYHFRD